MSDVENHISGAGSPTRSRPPPSRRRDKPQLSCNLCRRRKLKCDREFPCGNCTKRGTEPQCIYPTRRSKDPEHQAPPAKDKNNVQERLSQLEDQVVSMMRNHKRPEPAHSVAALATPSESTGSVGGSSSADEDIHEAGTAPSPDCTNWSSILNELRGKGDAVSYLACSHKYRDAQNGQRQPQRPLLLYGCPPATDIDGLLAALPHRSLANRMISNYFNGLDLSSAIIHAPEFLKEYEAFWQAPRKVFPCWLAMLYAMLCTSIQFQIANPETAILADDMLVPSFNIYREKVVQCLMFGKYTDGGPFVVPALIHYVVIEFFDMKDAYTGIWILMGILINIARQLRYDCDPANIPSLSPYESEMRRRHWRALTTLDNAISESVGMLRFMKNIENVSEPRNLLDSDFDAKTVTLPPSRPDTEPTPMLYCLAKGRALAVLSQVTDLVNANRPGTYSDVMRVDTNLMKAYSNIPSCYRWRSMSLSITDSAQVICRRMYLEIVYLKARVVLHLKYVKPSKTPKKYEFSRRTILDSVSKLLEFHHICDEETQPSGQLFSARWRYLIAVHQNFLLASIAACFFLEHNKANLEGDELQRFKALCRRSQGIWIRASRSSMEASKAAEALRIALDNGDDAEALSIPAPQVQLGDLNPVGGNMGNTFLPDYFGGFDLPFSYFGLFDGLTTSEPLADTPDSILVPPVCGQMTEYMSPGAWAPAPEP